MYETNTAEIMDRGLNCLLKQLLAPGKKGQRWSAEKGQFQADNKGQS